VLFNLLDFPAGVVPMCVIRPDEQTMPEGKVNDIFTKRANAALQNSAGLPVGVQIAALPFQDELVLRLMKRLSAIPNKEMQAFYQERLDLN
jgi:fatty acid amide hydrolase